MLCYVTLRYVILYYINILYYTILYYITPCRHVLLQLSEFARLISVSTVSYRKCIAVVHTRQRWIQYPVSFQIQLRLGFSFIQWSVVAYFICQLRAIYASTLILSAFISLLTKCASFKVSLYAIWPNVLSLISKHSPFPQSLSPVTSVFLP
jgi:hypothetical protein